MLLSVVATRAAENQPTWIGHDRTRPLPAVVDPGVPSSAEQPGSAPSDAIVLFDGGDVSKWVAKDGQATKWISRDGALECVSKAGDIRTLQSFGACQLHIEFATPAVVKGDSQDRGNSGIFFGMGRYEVQVLDSYQNKTYADGSCGSIYNQFPPLVNASRKPGEWQTYDIVWTPPKFDREGTLISAARVTVLHNGVLIQNNVELIGETDWLTHPPYRAHPEKLPILLQDHGNPIRYRNVWVRELDPGTPAEYALPDATLNSYVGIYGDAEITRKETNLVMKFNRSEFVLFASSPTHFVSKIVDVQVDFDPTAKALTISVGEDRGMRKERK